MGFLIYIFLSKCGALRQPYHLYFGFRRGHFFNILLSYAGTPWMGNSEWFGIFSESERGCAQRDSFITTHKSDLRLCKGIGTHCITLHDTYIQFCHNKNSKQCCTCLLLKVWILREDLPLFIFKNISVLRLQKWTSLTHFNKNDKTWLCAESKLLISSVVPSLDLFRLTLFPLL